MRTLVAASLLFLASTHSFAESPVEAFADQHTLAVVSIDLSDLAGSEPLAKRLAKFVPADQQADLNKLVKKSELPFMLEIFKNYNAREAMCAVACDGAVAERVTGGNAPVLRTQVILSFDDPKDMVECARDLNKLLRRSTFSIAPVDWQHLALVDRSNRQASQPSLGFLLRPDLVEPLTALRAKHPVAMVVSPGSMSQILESTAELPAAVATLYALKQRNNFERVELGLDLNQGTADLRWVARDEQSTSALFNTLPQMLTSMLDQAARDNPEINSAGIVAAIDLKQDGRSMTATIPLDNPAVQQLVWTVVGGQAKQAGAVAQQQNKLNQFKQMLLAMHNHHDTYRTFPDPQAIVNEDGKPLLSWRVAILPFVEQQALYDSFHLDEPWDSEHNLEVAKQMPELYGDSAHPDLVAKGLTTFQMPVFDEADPRRNPKIKQRKQANGTFHIRDGVAFASITDGTSKTIAMVEVAPEHAVPWTKPVDWQVDLDDPKAELTAEGRERIVAGFFDGHAKFLKLAIDSETLSAMLTKRGNEVYDDREFVEK